ncbi:MAG: hypothetical protein QOE17_397, partial [Gaiellales bacterium]|nr:hypothetical protein [Gaiellales bacterium]
GGQGGRQAAAGDQAATGADQTPGQRGAGQGGRSAAGDQTAGADQSQAGANPQARSAFVLVLGEDGQPTPRRIQVGSSDERNTQVIAGLQPGEVVATGILSGEQQQTPAKPQTGGGGLIPIPGGGGRPAGAGGGAGR